MTRVILINIFAIMAPFLLYGLYVMLDKKPETKAEFWKLMPMKTLLVIGFALMALFYITQIKFTGQKDGIYHPATIKDGKVIPGYIEPFDKTGQKEAP